MFSQEDLNEDGRLRAPRRSQEEMRRGEEREEEVMSDEELVLIINNKYNDVNVRKMDVHIIKIENREDIILIITI